MGVKIPETVFAVDDEIVIISKGHNKGKQGVVTETGYGNSKIRLANGTTISLRNNRIAKTRIKMTNTVVSKETEQKPLVVGDWVSIDPTYKPESLKNIDYGRIDSFVDGTSEAVVSTYDNGTEATWVISTKGLRLFGSTAPVISNHVDSNYSEDYPTCRDEVRWRKYIDLPVDVAENLATVKTIVCTGWQTPEPRTITVAYKTKWGETKEITEESTHFAIKERGWKTTSSSSYQSASYKKEDILIEVVGGITWSHSVYEDELERAKKVLDWHPGKDKLNKDVTVFTITKEQASYKRKSKNCLCCAFDATNKYMQHNLGMMLDEDDKDWYQNHPKTTQSGLEQAYTITVLNELVMPHGLGVSHVWKPKGVSAFEEDLKWQEVLGINPMAMVSRDTSNAEFLELMGPASEHIEDKVWGFEYIDILPDMAYVSMASMGTQTSFASGMGHASYYGPRGHVYGFQIALKYDKLEYIKAKGIWRKEPHVIEYLDGSTQVLNWEACYDNNGRLISSTVTRGGSATGTGSGGVVGSGPKAQTPIFQGALPGSTTPQTIIGVNSQETTVSTPTTTSTGTAGDKADIVPHYNWRKDHFREIADRTVMFKWAEIKNPLFNGFKQWCRYRGLKIDYSTFKTELLFRHTIVENTIMEIIEALGNIIPRINMTDQKLQDAMNFSTGMQQATASDCVDFGVGISTLLYISSIDGGKELAEDIDLEICSYLNEEEPTLSLIEWYGVTCIMLNDKDPLIKLIGVEVSTTFMNNQLRDIESENTHTATPIETSTQTAEAATGVA